MTVAATTVLLCGMVFESAAFATGTLPYKFLIAVVIIIMVRLLWRSPAIWLAGVELMLVCCCAGFCADLRHRRLYGVDGVRDLPICEVQCRGAALP